MLSRLIWQQIGRSLDLHRPHFFQSAPDRDALGVAIGRQTEEKQQPRGRLHHISRCVLKYVLQIVFALTSNPLFVRERTITQQSTQEVKEGNPMKKTIAAISIAVIGSLACPVLLTAAEENERTVEMTDLPAAVQTPLK